VPYEVDDTFNLPPVVALLVMILYMLLGSVVYPIWEKSWTPFDAFYFIFISLSTIGLGDVVPQHTKFFMMTSLYIFIGLALVAMVINVVMEEMNVAIAKAADMIVAARPRLDEETVQRIIKNIQMRQEASKPPPEVEEAIEETLVSGAQSCPTYAGVNGHVITSARFPGDNLHVDSSTLPARGRRSSM
jgi:Ion channel